MGEKGVGKLSRETPPPREGEPMGAASEGQALWQPGGAEENSHLREGNRHLHLA